MVSLLMDNESIIRFVAFAGVFATVAMLEIVTPRRVLTCYKASRWFANISITALNPLAVRLLFPFLPVGLAFIASEHHWGLLNNIAVPYWLKVFAAVILLDLTIYLQHVLHHAIPILWRLHMMHHTDIDIDVTTGLRFHPLEIVVSMCIKLMAVIALGPPALAVLIFEIVLNATSMFNHGNIRIPQKLDSFLRLLVVTPDMHRVHHSVIIQETNSNYGFNFPWWDRLLGTYKKQPAEGHEHMSIGLSQFRDAQKLSLPRLLILPFVSDPGRVPINRR
jgi:sterol desaturase/sphingolipid hydroxylase (fatty acid hydroxylase superfamily)